MAIKKTTSTKKSRKTTAKTANVTKLAPKPAAPVAGVSLSEVKPAGATTTINRKALLDRLKARTPSMKGSDVRQVMDAMLIELGEALAAGEDIKIPELGNMRVVKQKETENANILTLKLRRKKVTEDAKEPLEPSGE
jgi:nucleoid DNA-binding protein